MADLKSQLSKYFEEVVDRVEVDDLLSGETVELKPQRRRTPAGWTVGLAAAAVVILLGVGSFWVFSPEPTTPSPVGDTPTTSIAVGTEPSDSARSGERFVVATGVFADSAIDWQLTAWQTGSGEVCAELGGVGCFTIRDGGYLSGMFITEPAAGGQEGWCGYGTVVDADSVELVLTDDTTVFVPVYEHPEFDVDFFVHCQVGGGPAGRLAAIAADGTILEELP